MKKLSKISESGRKVVLDAGGLDLLHKVVDDPKTGTENLTAAFQTLTLLVPVIS